MKLNFKIFLVFSTERYLFLKTSLSNVFKVKCDIPSMKLSTHLCFKAAFVFLILFSKFIHCGLGTHTHRQKYLERLYVLLIRWVHWGSYTWLILEEYGVFLMNSNIWVAYTFLGIMKVKMLVTQSSSTLCSTMDCSPPGSSVHGILQARILEWVAIPFSRRSS